MISRNKALFAVAMVSLLLPAWRGTANAQAVPDEGVPAAIPSVTQAPVVDSKFAEAKQRFLQGVALAKAGNCAGAISELRASYQLVPRTNTLFNIAHCHEELFQYSLAIAAYEKFLATAKSDDPDFVGVKATIRALRGLLGTLVIGSNVPAEVWLGDRKIGSAPGNVLIPGGRHVLELRAKGYLAARKEIEIAGRKSLTLDFTLIVAQKKVTITKIETRGLGPVLFYGGAAATGLAFAGGLYFGAKAKISDSAAQRIDSRLPRDDQKSQIKTFSHAADALFIVTSVFAVGTTVTYFLVDWGEPEITSKAKRSRAARALRVLPQVSANSWGLSLSGAL